MWAEEVPNVLWAYQTDNRKPTGESPFCLIYATEALIPVEIGEPSLRLSNYDPLLNELGVRTNFDFLEEIRESVVINMANYKQKTAQYFKKVNPRKLFNGDLVLRFTAVSNPTHSKKLDTTWEGPYLIQQVLRPGTFYIL